MSPTKLRIGILSAMLLLTSFPARALITGNTGYAPAGDGNWPAGSVDLVNLHSRIAYWEGPPHGGGEFHFLYRGDTASFQHALDTFAKINAPERRLIIREGLEESFWLQDMDPSSKDTHVDWTFIVWTPRSWHQMFNNPFNALTNDDPRGGIRNSVPPPSLAVNIAGPDGKGIDWTQIKLPPGITLVDERATSAGYDRADASVLRGDVYDLLSSKPIPAAQITVANYNSKSYVTIAQTQSDPAGHFELKHVPAGKYRISVAAPGHASRTLGSETFGPNTLKHHTVQLTTSITASGTVLNTDGTSLPGVTVQATCTIALDGRGYLLPDPVKAVTDAHGAFQLPNLPEGSFQLFASDDSHEQLDSIHIFGPPSNGTRPDYTHLTLHMTATGTVKGALLTPADGANPRNVSITSTGDHPINWSGDTAVHPDGTFEFTKVPPGPYLLSTAGLPHDAPDPAAKRIEVKANQITKIELTK
ncbi:MAG TPA: carboxypeptidase regulatory-like domain-containing protein [Tepidisphaeraceae bacterium]|jgi:hypothetical protein|nr:carboxypeptidase regulatory-like domain-containing protein [Tepidisphaeraceae bacterium]